MVCLTATKLSVVGAGHARDESTAIVAQMSRAWPAPTVSLSS